MFEKRGSLQNEHNDRVVEYVRRGLAGLPGWLTGKNYLPVQGTQAPSRVREDPACLREAFRALQL